MPDAIEWPQSMRGESLRLSREERDHIAGHALDSILELCGDLSGCIDPRDIREGDASSCARKIAVLSNLLGDIGWEREPTGAEFLPTVQTGWTLGELFPVAQLRPWLEEWQHQDDEALVGAERALEIAMLESKNLCEEEPTLRIAMTDALTKLGTGALLLARIEKWMASHGT